MVMKHTGRAFVSNVCSACNACNDVIKYSGMGRSTLTFMVWVRIWWKLFMEWCDFSSTGFGMTNWHFFCRVYTLYGVCVSCFGINQLCLNNLFILIFKKDNLGFVFRFVEYNKKLKKLLQKKLEILSIPA